jgi:hypothetical protein
MERFSPQSLPGDPATLPLDQRRAKAGMRLAVPLDAQTPQALQRIEEALSQATRQYIRGPCSTHLSPPLWSPQVLHDR